MHYSPTPFRPADCRFGCANAQATPRATHFARSSSLRYPPGATYTNPLRGRPVKSIGGRDARRGPARTARGQLERRDRPAAHLAAKQEADAAEHRPFGKVLPEGKPVASALRQILPGRRLSDQRVASGTRARCTQPSSAPYSVNCTKPAPTSTAIHDPTAGTVYFPASASAS